MRIRQVQTLVWIGDALVLAGAAWAGGGFVRAVALPATVAKADWPEVAGTPFVAGRPHPRTDVEVIVTTPVDGVIRRPVEPPPPPPPPPPDVEFRRMVRITGGFVGSSATTAAQLTFDSRPRSLRLGESIDTSGRSWQLVEFVQGVAGGVVTAVFRSGDLLVSVTEERPATGPLTERAPRPFVATFEAGGPIDPELVRVDWIGRRSFPCPRTGEWTVTAEELLWWETFGEAEFFSKLEARTETDDDGNARGVHLVTVPSPPALGGGRGISQGDVIVAINEVPVREWKDLTNYLRGDGRGLERYDVVVERSGERKTIVYKVERRGTVTGRL